MCDLGSKMTAFSSVRDTKRQGRMIPISQLTPLIRQISADFRPADKVTAADSQNHRQNHIEKSIHV